MHQGLSGVGDLDRDVIGSIANASGTILVSAGAATKDVTTGAGNFFHNALGGIGGTIKWIFILHLIAGLTYIMISTNSFPKLSCFSKIHARSATGSLPPSSPVSLEEIPLTTITTGSPEDTHLHPTCTECALPSELNSV